MLEEPHPSIFIAPGNVDSNNPTSAFQWNGWRGQILVKWSFACDSIQQNSTSAEKSKAQIVLQLEHIKHRIPNNTYNLVDGRLTGLQW